MKYYLPYDKDGLPSRFLIAKLRQAFDYYGNGIDNERLLRITKGTYMRLGIELRMIRCYLVTEIAAIFRIDKIIKWLI